MTTTTSVPETLSPGTYRIDEERCLITFRTRHLFGLGAVRGTFRLRSGEIRLAEQVQDSAVRATVDAESFHTGNPGRDRTVRSARLLDTAEHPIFTFTSTQVAESGGRRVVRGRLVVRDAEHPVELTIEQARAEHYSPRTRSVRVSRRRMTRKPAPSTRISGGRGREL